MELRNEISRTIQRLVCRRAFEDEVLDDPEVEELWLASLGCDYVPAVRRVAA